MEVPFLQTLLSRRTTLTIRQWEATASLLNPTLLSQIRLTAIRHKPAAMSLLQIQPSYKPTPTTQ
jgi:hypothetical protein